MEASTFLEQVESIDILIKNKLIERQQWEDLAYSITAQMGGERVQSSGSQSKMADAVIRCLAEEEEIDRQVERLAAKKRDVVSVIEQLKLNEYDVLHMKYIQKLSFYDIAEAKGHDYNWATTVHGRGKQSVQRILDARKNNSASCDAV